MEKGGVLIGRSDSRRGVSGDVTRRNRLPWGGWANRVSGRREEGRGYGSRLDRSYLEGLFALTSISSAVRLSTVG